MKPYIISPEISIIGQKLLPIQYENIKAEDMQQFAQSLSVVAYAMPKEHSLQEAWIFWLFFNNGIILEFSSACTIVSGWQEAGSLNIKLIDESTLETSAINAVMVKVTIPTFQVNSIAKLTHEDNTFCTEFGVAISGGNNELIVIATGIAPGSVSISAPFSTLPFKPEFSVIECKRDFFNAQQNC